MTTTGRSPQHIVERLSAFSRAPIGGHEEEVAFFDVDGRRYYSVAYRPAAEAERSTFGVVVCHSFGFEHATLHPLEVMVARGAADGGIPALYLHAQGYGDSGGDFADVTLATHVRDVLVGADRLRAIAGVREVVLAGPRYGGTVALLAAAEAPDRVRGVAAWHPLVRPKGFFESVLRSAAVGQLTEGAAAGPRAMRRRLEAEGWLDLYGYPVRRSQFEEGVALDLTERLGAAPERALLVQATRGGRPDHAIDDLRAALEGLGAKVAVETVALEAGQDFALPVPHAVTPVVMRPPFEAIAAATLAWLRELV